MSWLLFMDESGHDHRQMPYEVRGGVALHASKIWPFEQAWRRLEEDCFGASLHHYGREIKGCKLLDKKRVRWSKQAQPMAAEERRRHCRGFLTKGLQKEAPTHQEFTAYGQACWEMAVGVFQLLQQMDGRVFASVIPRGSRPPKGFQLQDFLRKDHVFLMERYYYFLNDLREHGLLVLDEVEKTQDIKFVERMQRYFTRTITGRMRSNRVVPSPFFVSSEMTHPVQAADLCIYTINWGFRLNGIGMNAEVREEIAENFGPWLNSLQFRGEGEREGVGSYATYGIVYVPDPFEARC
ncbi:MAG: DUF3800 domain-containing protein [Candidatus Sumerlaeia bacterium]|nr:DUF3800 domain-containing protein [Candidatus Sumerlaeia bacterium]